MTHEHRQQQAENFCNGFVRELFKPTCHEMTATEVQQWIHGNEHTLPSGIRSMLFAAHNACVACGAYDYAREQAEFEGD